jgi:hypothetical protein
MRQIHHVPARTERQQLIEVLRAIQTLCARDASPSTIWETCETAIMRLNGRH